MMIVMPSRRYRRHIANCRRRQCPTFPVVPCPRRPIPVTIPAMDGNVRGWIIGFPPDARRMGDPARYVEQEYVVLIKGDRATAQVEHSAVVF